jgi:carboxylesterase type B
MMIPPSVSHLLAVGAGIGTLVSALDTTTVKTDNGVVKGFTDESFPNVAQFLGIPYAEPPVGKRRWAPAVTKGRFGTLDASHQGPACPQAEPSNSGPWRPEFLIKPNSTSEDCLYLNVWTPYKARASNKGKLPVLVWIHGGGFTGVRYISSFSSSMRVN